jgi:hypothetical protein
VTKKELRLGDMNLSHLSSYCLAYMPVFVLVLEGGPIFGPPIQFTREYW